MHTGYYYTDEIRDKDVGVVCGTPVRKEKGMRSFDRET